MNYDTIKYAYQFREVDFNQLPQAKQEQAAIAWQRELEKSGDKWKARAAARLAVKLNAQDLIRWLR